jgi:hypothetical protein
MSDGQANGLPWWRSDPWLGGHLFGENRNKNAHLTVPYNNMYIAWFPDGSGIRDADVDRVVLWERIKGAGDDPSWYCYEYIENDAIF